jgi:hypothetical protein
VDWLKPTLRGVDFGMPYFERHVRSLQTDHQVRPTGTRLVELANDLLGIDLGGVADALRNSGAPSVLAASACSRRTPVHPTPIG